MFYLLLVMFVFVCVLCSVFGPLPARIRGRRQPSALHASNTHLWPSNYGKDQAVQKYRNTGMLLQLCSIYLCIKIYQEYRNTWLHNSVQLCIKHSILLVRPHQEFKPKRKKRMKQKCKKLSLSMKASYAKKSNIQLQRKYFWMQSGSAEAPQLILPNFEKTKNSF